jgi:hypothetical protein
MALAANHSRGADQQVGHRRGERNRFDVDFSSASALTADQTFEDALRNAGGSVVLPAFKQLVGDRGSGTIHVGSPAAPIAELHVDGGVNVEPDSDGLVRRYPLGQTLGDMFLPSVGALLAGKYETHGGSLLIDFGIRAASVPIISYVDVLGGGPAVARALKGKKVIVGATALELSDRINVPNGQIIPGALLQAIAAESILQGRALRTASAVVTIGGLGVIILAMSALWRRFAAGTRIAMLLGSAVTIELTATALQAMVPVVVDTSLFHAAVFAYLVAIMLDEIDLGTCWEDRRKRFQRIATSLGDGLVCGPEREDHALESGRCSDFWLPARGNDRPAVQQNSRLRRFRDANVVVDHETAIRSSPGTRRQGDGTQGPPQERRDIPLRGLFLRMAGSRRTSVRRSIAGYFSPQT